MKAFLKYLGVIFVLIGVTLLVVYHFVFADNLILVGSAVAELIGIILFIVLNKVLD